MRTNGIACPCIDVVCLIVGVRCMERPLIEVPFSSIKFIFKCSNKYCAVERNIAST